MDAMQWLDGVARDPGVPPASFRLAYVLTRSTNAEGKVVSRYVMLAAASGLSAATAKAGVLRLAERGHLKMTFKWPDVHISLAAKPVKRLLSSQDSAP